MAESSRLGGPLQDPRDRRRRLVPGRPPWSGSGVRGRGPVRRRAKLPWRGRTPRPFPQTLPRGRARGRKSRRPLLKSFSRTHRTRPVTRCRTGIPRWSRLTGLTVKPGTRMLRLTLPPILLPKRRLKLRQFIILLKKQPFSVIKLRLRLTSDRDCVHSFTKLSRTTLSR